MLYVCYGIPKSASSFVFQVTTELVASAPSPGTGRMITARDLVPELSVNAPMYAESILDAMGRERTDESLEWLIKTILDAQSSGSMPLRGVLKTHTAPTDAVLDLVNVAAIYASATYRHPADLLLSRADMAIRDGEQARDYLRNYRRIHVPAFFRWATSPEVLTLPYSEIATRPHSVSRAIASQIGGAPNPEAVVDALLADTSRIHQFNIGRENRHRDEMSPQDVANIEAQFPDLMALLKGAEATPRTIGVVTSVLNAENAIDETIQSVLNQRGFFNIRYHIQDGGSTDGTVVRIAWWEESIRSRLDFHDVPRVSFSYASAPDSGMYEGLNAGFKAVEADVYTWINAGDVFLPGAFQTVISLLDENADIHWVLGGRSVARSDGVPIFQMAESQPSIPTQRSIASGHCDGVKEPHIQQEGSFWSARVWDAVGASLRHNLSLAGDFELWTRLAHVTRPVFTAHPLATFRRMPGQLSEDKSRYQREAQSVRESLGHDDLERLSDEPLEIFAALPPHGHWRAYDAPTLQHLRTLAISPSDSTRPDGTRHRLFGDGLLRQRIRKARARHIERALKDGSLERLGRDVVLEDASLQTEGPIPSQGLTRPFLWLTGYRQTLHFHSEADGCFEVRLTLLSPLGRQVITVKEGSVIHPARLRTSHLLRRPYVLTFRMNVISGKGSALMTFSHPRRTAFDGRELSSILLGLTISDITV